MKRKVFTKSNSIRLTAMRRPLYAIMTLAMIMSFSLASSAAAADPQPVKAPLNPAFERRLNAPLAGAKTAENSGVPEGQSLGWIPSPLNLPNFATLPKPEQKVSAAATLPATYDLRTQGRVTPVRNQNLCGCCWAFSNIGSYESVLMPDQNLDFSEMNLKNTHGFDYGHCDGGNGDMATAYFARWSAPVWELEDPYDHTSDVSPIGLTEKKHLQDVYLIPERSSGTDNDGIKTAIMEYGGVAVSLFFGAFYNENTYAYYYDGFNDPNHGGTLVGWDDNFDRNNFLTTPPGDGAWIVKNTWSEYWGDAGYYYVSYYDQGMMDQKGYVYFGEDDVSNYDDIYQYDPLGWTSSIGYGSATAYMANIFSPNSDDHLAAVSFYAPTPGTSYTISIYDGVGSTPTSGSLVNTPQSGVFLYAGYHTVELDELIPITGGSDFSIVIEITAPGTTFPIAMETPVGGYASNATANNGESFIGYNGTSWTDLNTVYSNTNVCIKAFTVRTIRYVAADINGDGQDDLVRYNEEIGLDWWDAATTTWTNLLPFTYQIIGGVTADTNADSKEDIAIVIESAGMHLRDSQTGTWTQILESHYTAIDLIAGKINADASEDLVANIEGQGLYWRDSATGTWTSLLPDGYDYRHLLAADLNNDAQDDIIVDIPGIGIHWRDSATGTWSLLLEDWFEPLQVLTADLNGDNRQDLIVAVNSYGLYWRDSNTGAWTQLEGPTMTMLGLVPADVDNNTVDDLFAYVGGYGLYEKNISTGVSTQILYANYAPITGETADINGDGNEDIMVDIYKVGQYWRDSATGTWTQILP